MNIFDIMFWNSQKPLDSFFKAVYDYRILFSYLARKNK